MNRGRSCKAYGVAVRLRVCQASMSWISRPLFRIGFLVSRATTDGIWGSRPCARGQAGWCGALHSDHLGLTSMTCGRSGRASGGAARDWGSQPAESGFHGGHQALATMARARSGTASGDAVRDQKYHPAGAGSAWRPTRAGVHAARAIVEGIWGCCP